LVYPHQKRVSDVIPYCIKYKRISGFFPHNNKPVIFLGKKPCQWNGSDLIFLLASTEKEVEEITEQNSFVFHQFFDSDLMAIYEWYFLVVSVFFNNFIGQ